MEHPRGISHGMEMHKGEAAWRSSELVQHQSDVFHAGVLPYGHLQVALTAAQRCLLNLFEVFYVSIFFVVRHGHSQQVCIPRVTPSGHVHWQVCRHQNLIHELLYATDYISSINPKQMHEA